MEDKTDLVQSLRVRRLYLLVGAVSIFFSGVVYAWSILKAPLSEDLGWSAQQLALNFTVTFCCYCLGCLAEGALLKKIGVRWSMLLAAAMVAVGFAVVSGLGPESVGLLYVGYGGLVGTGIGLAYIAIVSTVKPWFPDKPGFCSGVLMMCFGVSTLILGNLASVLFSLPWAGWRVTYLGLGIAICAVLIVGGAVLHPPSAADPLPAPREKTGSRESFGPMELTAGQMLRRKTFWLFYLYNVLTAAAGNTVFSFARDYALSIGAAASLATFLVGAASVCNGCGRILSGVLYDRWGRRRTMLAVNLLVILGPAMLLAASLTGSQALCAAGLCVAGISYGCGSTISATFVGDFYGRKDYSMNLGIVTSALIPVSFIATLSSWMIGRSGSYISTYIVLICCGVAALAANLSIRRP